MLAPATGSDWVDEDFFPDSDLINDLESGTLVDAGLPAIYNQLVVMNKLLGLICAILFVGMIFALMRFTMHLIQHNITNLF